MPNFLKNLIAGLSERERRLVAVAGIVFIIMIVFLLVFIVRTRLSDIVEENARRVESLRLLDEKRENFLASQSEAKSEASWKNTKPTPLRTMIEKIGNQLEVTVPSIKELPDQRHGDSWMEHLIELSMNEIEVVKLVKFMEQVEANRRKFPIAITKLDIRKRRRTDNAFNVKMVISTYEYIKESDERRQPKSKSQSKSGRKVGR